MNIYIERDAHPGAALPDLLVFPSGNVRWLSREDTEALEPLLPDPSLPEGVHRAPDGRMWLAPEADLPEGWEWRNVYTQWNTGSWDSSTRSWCWEVRPVPAPKTERVPWHEAVSCARTVRIEDDEFTVTTAFHDAQGRFCIGTPYHEDDINLVVPADGTVEVLKDPS